MPLSPGPGITSNLIPVFLIDAAGAPLIGPVTFAGGETLVSLDEADFGNALGAIHEIGGAGNGRGMFVYGATAEEYAHSIMTFAVKKTGVAAFLFTSALPFQPELYAGETDDSKRTAVVYVVNSSGVGLTGKTKTDVNLAVSSNAGAWVAAAGTFVAIAGVDGAYRYHFTDDELVNGLVLVILGGGVTGARVFAIGTFVGPPQNSGANPPAPLPVPVVYGDPDYIDLVQKAIDRLPYQFRE